MKLVGIQSGKLLSWHREIHQHPIFSPKYARENLMSLVETLFMFYLYLSLILLALHYFVLNGFLESETITWLMVEASAREVMFSPSEAVFLDRGYVLLALGLLALATFITRISFDLAKAKLHPNALREASRYKMLVGGRKSIEVMVFDTINQFRKEVKNAKGNKANDNLRAPYRFPWRHKIYSDG